MNEPPDQVFFTDRDLGKQFPSILKNAGLQVERHCDHFEDDEEDDVWLRVVGQRGWVVLTHNKRIRYTPNERDAVMHARVAMLVIIGKARIMELADSFVQSAPKVLKFMGAHEPPYIAKVFRPYGKARYGKVEIWLSYEDWKKQQI